MDYGEWFYKPEWDLTSAEICKQSGYLASDICPDKYSMMIPKRGLETDACPYHHLIHLDEKHIRFW